MSETAVVSMSETAVVSAPSQLHLHRYRPIGRGLARCRRRGAHKPGDVHAVGANWSIYLQAGWPLTTAIFLPGGHPFGCGWTSLGTAGGGAEVAAAAAGAIGL